MTELLEQAIAKLKMLPASEQDARSRSEIPAGIATIIIEELEDEIQWDRAFSGSQDALSKLATEAMAEYHAFQTQELDPETL